MSTPVASAPSGTTATVRAGASARLVAWLAKEWARTTAGDGRRARTLRWVAARPAVVLLPPAAIGPGLLGAAIPDGDAGWFREAGLSMLGPGFLDVFSSPGLQIGPLYLLLVGVLAWVCQAVGLPVLFTVAAVQSTGLAAYALHLAGRWARELGRDALRARWGVVAPLVLLGPLAECIGNGHPEEVLLGLLLAHLLLLVRHGRATGAGVVIGLATGLKLWGALAGALVLLARRWRVLVVAGAWAVVLAAVAYLPFVLGGEVATFSFRWGTRLEPFGLSVDLGAFAAGWGFRVVQAALVVAASALVAWRWPGTGVGAALALVTVRIVSDPLLQMYYALPALVLALLWVWTAPGARSAAWRVWSGPVVLVASIGPYLVLDTVRLAVTHVALVVLTVAVVRADAAQARCAGETDTARTSV